MKRALAFLGLFGAALMGIAQGCGGDDDDGGAASGSKVPPGPEGPPTTATDERTFAVNALHLGEATRAGVADPNAWKAYGYDLDGLATNATDRNSPDLARVCKRLGRASAAVHQDGDQGVDNAFGKSIVPLFGTVGVGSPTRTITDAIRAGQFTILMSLKGLTDDPAQSNTGLTGKYLIGAPFGDASAPTFSPADDWPYLREPQVPITGAYVTKGTFVSSGGSIQLTLLLGGQSLAITIRNAIVTAKHAPGSPEDLTEGTIAGVVETEPFLTGLGNVAGSINPSLCNAATLEGIKTIIREASDSLYDGPQDPARDCNAISIGLGFSARRVGAPTKAVEPAAAPVDPCAAPVGDGGTDAGDAAPNDGGGDAGSDAGDGGSSDAGDAGDADAN